MPCREEARSPQSSRSQARRLEPQPAARELSERACGSPCARADWDWKARPYDSLRLRFHQSKMIEISCWIIFITMKNKNRFVAFRRSSHAVMAMYRNMIRNANEVRGGT